MVDFVRVWYGVTYSFFAVATASISVAFLFNDFFWRLPSRLMHIFVCDKVSEIR